MHKKELQLNNIENRKLNQPGDPSILVQCLREQAGFQGL